MQPGSFDQIYQDYFDSVYRYALSLSGNPQAAEEIAQETFFKAMRTLDQFQGKMIMDNFFPDISEDTDPEICCSDIRSDSLAPISGCTSSLILK